RGWIKVVDTQGTVTALTDEFWGIEGLVWTPDGTGVVFSGATGGVEGYQPRITSAAGATAVQQLLPTVGSVIVLDVAREGRYIFTRADDRISVRVRTTAMKEERELSWLNSALEPHLSADEKLVLFTDQSEAAGPTYATASRSVTGGPVARLGEGDNYGF